MTLDRRRLLRGLGLAAWAAFFDYLWITDEAARYVGSRTAWVVPFGAVALTLTAVAYLVTARVRGHAEPPSRRDALGVVALLAPVLLIVVIPAPSLGALAVAKKQGNRVVASADAASGREGALTIFDVSAASTSPEFARVREVSAGKPVVLLGFVADTGPQGFTLARFVASCCAADAVPYTAQVRPPEGADAPAVDTWVEVKGVLAKGPDGFVVEAASLEETEEPSDAFLGY